jgi:uncharacterized membrane protein YhhN
MPALIAAIAVSALLEIAAETTGHRRSVYLLKPLTTGLIVVLAATTPQAVSGFYRTTVVLGLLFSVAGDVFLMLPGDRFVQGLASFLVAHICYIVAFSSVAGSLSALGGLFLLGWGAFLLGVLWARLGAYRVPVAVYAVVLLMMAWTAIAARVAVGALLFVASDSALALERFGRKHRWAQTMVLSTYFAAQLLIALSVTAISYKA